MRTIDADALMADLEKWLKQIDPTHPSEDNAIPPMEDIIVSTLMTIEEQTTVEPQKMRGRWIPTEPDEPCFYLCSICRRLNDEKDNFCKNCGAKMEGTE